MAAYVQDIVTWTTVTGNKSATITPAVNGLLVVFCGVSGVNVQPTVTDDQGGTYDFLVASARNAGAAGDWAFVRTALSSNVAHVVTMTTNGLDSGGGLDVIEVSGMSRVGARAVRTTGFKSNLSAGVTPTCDLAQSALTANPVLCSLFAVDNTCTATVPSGYTQRQNAGYGTPNTGLGIYTRNSGETTNLITWGGTETGASSTLALEMDITGMTHNPPVFEPVPFIPPGRSM